MGGKKSAQGREFKVYKEKDGKERKRENKRKKGKKLKEKGGKKNSQKNLPATHSAVEENSTQKKFGGGEKSNFSKNIYSLVSQKRYPSEKPF